MTVNDSRQHGRKKWLDEIFVGKMIIDKMTADKMPLGKNDGKWREKIDYKQNDISKWQ